MDRTTWRVETRYVLVRAAGSSSFEVLDSAFLPIIGERVYHPERRADLAAPNQTEKIYRLQAAARAATLWKVELQTS